VKQGTVEKEELVDQVVKNHYHTARAMALRAALEGQVRQEERDLQVYLELRVIFLLVP
jgi:hypothetical protein